MCMLQTASIVRMFVTGFFLIALVVVVPASSAFAPPHVRSRQQTISSPFTSSLSIVHHPRSLLQHNHHHHHHHHAARFDRTLARTFFFRRNKEAKADVDDDDDKSDDEKVAAKEEQEEQQSGGGGLGGLMPFFAGLTQRNKGEEQEEKTTAAEDTTGVTAVAAATAEPEVEVKEEETPALAPPVAKVKQEQVPPPKKKPVLTPEEQAQQLRSEAEKMRLEAERMDAELTLRKIERLEKEISAAKKKKQKGTDDSSVEELQREMDALLDKMRGDTDEKPKPSTTSRAAAPTSTTSTTTTTPPSVFGEERYYGELANLVTEPMSQEKLDEMAKYVTLAPSFLKKTLATSVELDYDDVDDINVTELALRMEKIARLDFSFSSLPAPTFTKQEIEKRKEEIKSGLLGDLGLDPLIIDAAKDNETLRALLSLEYSYYAEREEEAFAEDFVNKIIKDEEWLQGITDAFNKTAVDSSIETLFPKCTRKEGQQPSLAQVQQLTTEILPKVAFSVTSKPEQVAGGFIIRGESRAESGDALISAIDEELAKSSLGEKMTVLFTNDFTIFADLEDDSVGFDTDAQLLYVVGPDIVRQPRRVELSITSSLGLATSWYLAIYPFLLNPAIAKRVDEQLALADANMTPDLNWLTELSIPLFVTFVGIQLLHELGHQIAARANGFKASVPTFVPSIITGITSSVTTFKSPPKNKEAMFDFSVAGPLVGIVASLAAIAVGAQLTLTGDPSYLPALPLEILRQSTLGGGIINAVLGNGALSVPEGALGTQAVAGITIPLHPVAIAGYISLVINALCLLPIGTTDGGRIGLAIFGRGAKLLVGNIFLVTLFLVGLLGSDLFLFYFAFVLAFQTGNEIPARNEVDQVGFSRIIVATVAYVLALLSLVPFQ